VRPLPDTETVDLAQAVAAYRGASIPAVLLPDAISAPARAAIRSHLAEAGLQPFDLAHQGRYAFNDTWAEPTLFEGLTAIAEHIAGASLEITRACWIQMVRGDYALIRDDKTPPDRSLELTLDLSAAPALDGGEVCYRHRGQLFFAVKPAPGTLALIERGPTIERYTRYLTHRSSEAVVVRLRLALRPV
jgi:hypothetical protein